MRSSAPGWTSYGTRLRCHTYDVTGMLRPVTNAIGAWLDDGWYRGKLGFHGGARNLYGDSLTLLAQLEIEHANGTRAPREVASGSHEIHVDGIADDPTPTSTWAGSR